MKKPFFYFIYLPLLGFSLLFSSCSNNNENNNVSENATPTEVQKVTIPGVYYWEGKSDIGYGLEVLKKITLTIHENGTATDKEVVEETGDVQTVELQWFEDKSGDICFGKFDTNKPDENSKGAQFIATVSGDGLTMSGSKSFYKKIK